MERDERQRAGDLDRHWDAVVRGGSRAAPAGSASDLAELIDVLHMAGGAIPPLFPDSRQAWRKLSQELSLETPASIDADDAAPIWPGPNGRAASPFRHRSLAQTPTSRPSKAPLPARRERGWGEGSPPRAGWLLAQMATAALLVITLAAGYIAFVQRAPTVEESALQIPAPAGPREEASFIPAAAGVADDTLFAATFTANMLPTVGEEAIFYRVTLPPGGSLPYLAGPCLESQDHCRDQISPGVGAEVVESGVYSLRLDAPLQVRRAGAPRVGEQIPAQSEITLRAGDAAVYGNYAASGEMRNAGDEPLVLVGVAILGTKGTGVPAPLLPEGAKGEVFTRTMPYDWQTLPPGPIVVNLHRLTIPPETTLGPYDALGLEAMYVESGEIRRSLQLPGAEEPNGPPFPRSAGYAVPFIGAGPGARHIVANAGDEPSEILVLTIAPAGLWSDPLMP